jgi:inner membrane protein
LSPIGLATGTVCLIAADWGSRLAGDSVFPGAPLDETAHLLTTLLICWALPLRFCRRFLAPALVAAVAIDVDHVPGRLGTDWLTAGTPRPYTHSLLTVAVIMLLALVWRGRRDLWLGVAIGLAIHLWRDMGEGSAGVSLLWPFSDRSFQYPHGLYLAVMAVFVLIDVARCRRSSHRARVKWRSRDADSDQTGGARRATQPLTPWHEIRPYSRQASIAEPGVGDPGPVGRSARRGRRARRVPIRRTASDSRHASASESPGTRLGRAFRADRP